MESSPGPASAGMPTSDDNGKLDAVVWRTAIAVIIGAFMSILDLTIVNVALQQLGVELGAAGLDEVQWVMTAYMLGVAAVIPVTGWASDRLGGKRLFLLSLVGFTVASAMCAVAWDIWSLVAFRALQGVAGGALLPSGQILLARAAGPKRMGRVMGVIGVPMLLAPVFGPVIGGLILNSLPWEWIFLVNVPIGVFGFVLAYRLMPPDSREHSARHAAEHPLDVRGLALLVLALPLIVYGLSNIPVDGLSSNHAWGPMLAGVVLLAGFVMHSRRDRDPLLNLGLLRQPPYAMASFLFFTVSSLLFGSIVLLPLYFQIVRGEDVLTTGLLMAPQGLGAAIGVAVTGRLTDRIGGGPVVLTGLVVLAIGTVPFTQMTEDTSYWLLAGAMLVRGVGFGSTMMPSMAAAFATLRREDVAHATPQVHMLRQIGGSVGTALLATILQAEIAAAIATAVGGSTVDIGSLGEGGLAGGAALPAAVAGPLAGAFGATFWWVLGGTLITMVPAVLLARAERDARRLARLHAGEG